MKILGAITGYLLAQIVNVISDLLFIISKPLWMKFGIWIRSLMAKTN